MKSKFFDMFNSLNTMLQIWLYNSLPTVSWKAAFSVGSTSGAELQGNR